MKKNNLELKNGVLILRMSSYFSFKKLERKVIPKIINNKFNYLIINLEKIKYLSRRIIVKLKKIIENLMDNKRIICICNCSKKIKLTGILFASSEVEALNLLAL